MSARHLVADRSGSSAAEFGMVLPLLILLLLGVLDAGRFIWEYNRAEKATAAGARVAIVTDVVAGGLSSTNYVGTVVGGVTLTQGDLIPAAALPTVTCTRTTCTPATGTVDSAAFDRIVERMQFMKPDIAATNVEVQYSGSGLGYAGNPNGMDINPLVTVKLTGLQYSPLILFGFIPFNMPDFRTTLTAEDSAGTESN
ncbi:MAG TPA: TadE/TadG family type IV pilus assembly protein [Steroidobacteraceae bacterium]|nr:TadE/TadG family type IV pilus assembly protein [Steroidobacteraceae bacterium]